MTALVELPTSETGGRTRRETAARSGYLFFRSLVDPARVLALRARVLEACGAVGWLDDDASPAQGVARPGARIGAHDEAWTEVQARVQPLPEFRSLREDPAIRRILEELYRGPLRSALGDTCRVFSPGVPELTTPPHQDGFYVGGEPHLWTVWIPLGDCPRVLGGLAVLPGSHRAGIRPHGGEDGGRQGAPVARDAVWASADYRCGDVLMFHGLTIHGALENRTGRRLRISADFRYGPADSRSPGDARDGGPDRKVDGAPGAERTGRGRRGRDASSGS